MKTLANVFTHEYKCNEKYYLTLPGASTPAEKQMWPKGPADRLLDRLVHEEAHFVLIRSV